MINNSKKHLLNSKESYFLHMLMAIKISSQLLSTSIKALVHAFIPALFTKSASNKITELYLLIQKRKNSN